MVETLSLDMSPQAFEALLNGRFEFMNPRRIVGGIIPEQAVRTVDGLPNSIALLVSHMHYWQERFIRQMQGEVLPKLEGFVYGETDFPPVSEAEWEALAESFSTGLDRLIELCRQPGISEAALAGSPHQAGFEAANQCLHNAYHLGQVVLMRRLLGIWPPAEEQPMG